MEWADSDGDGVGDNSDPSPNDCSGTFDSDGDGVCDDFDAFPMNGMEWADSDGDGVETIQTTFLNLLNI